MLLAGCSERDVFTFTFEQSLDILLKTQCDDDDACIDAVDAQLGACIENNPDIDALVAAGGANDELSDRGANDITRCIVDDQGEPYFYTGEEPDSEEPEYVPFRTVIPR